MMMNDDKNKTIVVNKIKLKDLIETLMELEEAGAMYIDLVVSPGEERDKIGIVIREGYGIPQEPFKKLTDEDINMLMNL